MLIINVRRDGVSVAEQSSCGVLHFFCCLSLSLPYVFFQGQQIPSFTTLLIFFPSFFLVYLHYCLAL